MTTSDNDLYKERLQVTTNDKEWQQMIPIKREYFLDLKMKQKT